MVEKTIQHGGDGGTIAQQLAPVLHWPVRRNQGAGSLVASHDDFQQFLGGRERQFFHAEIVDDKQGNRGEQFHVFFSFAIERGIGQFFKKDVGFAIDHTIALLDDGVTDGLGQVTFSAAWGTVK